MLVMCEREGIAALGFVPRVLPARAGDLRLELLEWSWQAETHPSAVLRVVEDDFFDLPGAEGELAMELAGLREYPEQFADVVTELVAPWADDLGGHALAATCERARRGVISWVECFGALAIFANDCDLDDRFDLGLPRSLAYVARDPEPDMEWLKPGIAEARAIALRVELAGLR